MPLSASVCSFVTMDTNVGYVQILSTVMTARKGRENLRTLRTGYLFENVCVALHITLLVNINRLYAKLPRVCAFLYCFVCQLIAFLVYLKQSKICYWFNVSFQLAQMRIVDCYFLCCTSLTLLLKPHYFKYNFTLLPIPSISLKINNTILRECHS